MVHFKLDIYNVDFITGGYVDPNILRISDFKLINLNNSRLKTLQPLARFHTYLNTSSSNPYIRLPPTKDKFPLTESELYEIISSIETQLPYINFRNKVMYTFNATKM